MIQFKFSKAMGYDSIPFSGIGMKLGDLKAAIMQKKGLNTATVAGRGPSVDLAITNAETNVGASFLSVIRMQSMCLWLVGGRRRVHEPGRSDSAWCVCVGQG